MRLLANVERFFDNSKVYRNACNRSKTEIPFCLQSIHCLNFDVANFIISNKTEKFSIIENNNTHSLEMFQHFPKKTKVVL